MADILGHLYDAWPAPIDLEPAVSIEETGVAAADNEKTDELWFNLGLWLEAEGIIRMDGGSLGSVDLSQAVLTAKGFEVLGKPTPGSEKTFGTRMQELAKEAGRDAAKEGAKKAMAELAGSFFGSIMKSASG
jgi:hypothetical protein